MAPAAIAAGPSGRVVLALGAGAAGATALAGAEAADATGSLDARPARYAITAAMTTKSPPAATRIRGSTVRGGGGEDTLAVPGHAAWRGGGDEGAGIWITEGPGGGA